MDIMVQQWGPAPVAPGPAPALPALPVAPAPLAVDPASIPLPPAPVPVALPTATAPTAPMSPAVVSPVALPTETAPAAASLPALEVVTAPLPASDGVLHAREDESYPAVAEFEVGSVMLEEAAASSASADPGSDSEGDEDFGRKLQGALCDPDPDQALPKPLDAPSSSAPSPAKVFEGQDGEACCPEDNGSVLKEEASASKCFKKIKSTDVSAKLSRLQEIKILARTHGEVVAWILSCLVYCFVVMHHIYTRGIHVVRKLLETKRKLKESQCAVSLPAVPRGAMTAACCIGYRCMAVYILECYKMHLLAGVDPAQLETQAFDDAEAIAATWSKAPVLKAFTYDTDETSSSSNLERASTTATELDGYQHEPVPEPPALVSEPCVVPEPLATEAVAELAATCAAPEPNPEAIQVAVPENCGSAAAALEKAPEMSSNPDSVKSEDAAQPGANLPPVIPAAQGQDHLKETAAEKEPGVPEPLVQMQSVLEFQARFSHHV